MQFSVSHAQVEPEAEPLRFGFSMNDLEQIAWKAVGWDRATRGMDRSDRYETAWFAVVDRLYSAPEPVERGELLSAAIHALLAMNSDDVRTRGFNQRVGKTAGPHSAPQFARYWLGTRQATTEPAFVVNLIDRMALRQVFACLTPPQRAALLALALHQDYARAAESLGLSGSAFTSRLERARERFLTLWHEHETPAARRLDKRLGRRELRPNVAAVLSVEQLPHVLLPDARLVFARVQAERMHSAVLLARLASLRPHLYGTWDQSDLGQALRLCNVPPAETMVIDGVARSAYRRAGIAQAAPVPEPVEAEPCDIILAAWLDSQRPDPDADPHAVMRRLVAQAGPAGISPRLLTERLHGRASLRRVMDWLREDVQSGAVARIGRGSYAAPQHATRRLAAEPIRELAPDHPRAVMLRLITQAGPDGITTGELADRTGANRSCLARWLREELRTGTVVKIRHGAYAYAATEPATPQSAIAVAVA
ncbi:hypothetical protein ACIBF1_42025 [Spirillospora sp. NPDC050679]